MSEEMFGMLYSKHFDKNTMVTITALGIATVLFGDFGVAFQLTEAVTCYNQFGSSTPITDSSNNCKGQCYTKTLINGACKGSELLGLVVAVDRR